MAQVSLVTLGFCSGREASGRKEVHMHTQGESVSPDCFAGVWGSGASSLEFDDPSEWSPVTLGQNGWLGSPGGGLLPGITCANRIRLSGSKANKSSMLWLENGEVQAWALEDKLSWQAYSPAASYCSLQRGQGWSSGSGVELCCSVPGCLSSSCCLSRNKTNFEIVLLIFLFLYPMKKCCYKAISVF